MAAVEGRGEDHSLNEDPEEQEQDFREFRRQRSSEGDAKDKAGRILRGCATALAIAFLVLAFVVGACFMSF
jgi:hypothetical protein